jgi:hypothetical protein
MDGARRGSPPGAATTETVFCRHRSRWCGLLHPAVVAVRAEWADSGAARWTDSIPAMLGATDMRAEWAGPAPPGAPYHWAVASAPSACRRVGVAILPAMEIGEDEAAGAGLAVGYTCAPAGAFALGWMQPPPPRPPWFDDCDADRADRAVFNNAAFERLPSGGALTHSCERCGDGSAFKPAHTGRRAICPLPRLLCTCSPVGSDTDPGRTADISLVTGLPMLRLAATMTTPRSRAVSTAPHPLARYWLVLAPFEVDGAGCFEALRGARRGGGGGPAPE